MQGFVYSASLDGSVKMWDSRNLELVESVYNAHDGGKVHCLTAGPDGNLYTGGEDKVHLSLLPFCSVIMYKGLYLYCTVSLARILTEMSAQTSALNEEFILKARV